MIKKRLTFAGSTVGEPWWTCGEITAAALAPLGYEVKVTDESYSHNNIPWIAEGRAEIGATTPRHFAAAARKRGVHAESDISRLRAIATISRPNWLAVAGREEFGVRDLRELAANRLPVRILAGGAERGGELDFMLKHYDLTLEEIVEWGGTHHRWSGRMEGTVVRDGAFDLMIGNIYAGYTPHGRYWYEATILHKMYFFDLESALLDSLANEFGYAHGTIPHGLFPGLDRDIASVQQRTVIVYCREDLPNDVARLIAERLDSKSDLFMLARSPLYYERHKIGLNDYITLHPAVEEYYKSKGYPIGSSEMKRVGSVGECS